MFVIIVGGGKTGSHLAELLLGLGHQVKVIEWRTEVFERLKTELPAEAIFLGDGAEPGVLLNAGIRRADVLAAVTGDDEDNLVVSTLGRFEFGVRRVIARVNNHKNAWLFTPENGVDVALNQADLMAHMIAEEMSLGDMMTLFKLRKGQFALVEEKVHPASVAVGKTLQSLNLPAECALAAVLRKGELLFPRGDLVLQPADEILAVVHASKAAYLAELLGPQAETR